MQCYFYTDLIRISGIYFLISVVEFIRTNRIWRKILYMRRLNILNQFECCWNMRSHRVKCSSIRSTVKISGGHT
jgi:hypothetical protein